MTSREQLNALSTFKLTNSADAIVVGCDVALDRHVIVAGRMRWKMLQHLGRQVTATCPHCGKVVAS